MFKRILAGILSAVIVFSSFSPAVNAAEITGAVQEEIVEETSAEELVEENVEEKAVEELETESEPETESEQEVKPEVFVVEEEITEVIEYATGTEGEKTVVEEGTCGENITWVFYDDGELVISGSGTVGEEAQDCYDYSWRGRRTSITKLRICENITSINTEAFYDLDNLVEVELPTTLENIGTRAFEYCSKLTNIVFPESLKTIGVEAFASCSMLSNITIPQNIISIGEDAFYSTVEEKTVIYQGTWEQWETIKTASSEYTRIYDKNVIAKQNYAYRNNGDDTATITGAGEGGLGGKIQIPDEIGGLKVTIIGKQAFLNNKEIISISIPSSVEKIDSSAFYGCELSEVNFATGLKHIMDYAFYNAIDNYDDGLILPDGLETIGSNAFSEISVKSVTVPISVNEIGLPAFNWNEDIIFDGSAQKWIDIHNANTKDMPVLESVSFSESEQAYVPYMDSLGNITGYELALWRDASGDVVIPETFRELPVISIRQSAFKDNETITSVVVPEYISSIGNGAFSNCVNLVEAKINTKETSVPWQLFKECISLKKVALPPFITYVGSDAFDQCISLEEVSFESSYNWNVINFDSGNTSLINAKTKNFAHDWGYKVDNYYENNVKEQGIEIIGKVTIEDNMIFPSDIQGLPVKAIGNQSSTESFMTGSEIIKNIQLPISLTYLCSRAFKNCVNLQRVTLSESLEYIYPSTFEGCSSLVSISLPDELSDIGEAAFKGCTSLENIIFPEKLVVIGKSAFEGCVSLKTITIPKDVEVINCSAFKNCTGLEKIVFDPKYENGISCHVFSGCIGVKEISMPDDGFHSLSNTCADLEWEEVGASVFESVPRTAKVKVAKDSYPARFMEEQGFTNLSVAIVLRDITLPSKVSVELGKTKTVSVTKVPTNANDSLNLVWTSADESIATVDENGVITGKNLGATQITVKDLNSGKTARTTVQVILPATSKITTKMSPAIDSLGLQSGQSVTMQIFATGIENDEAMDPSFFTFTSSDDSIVTVDENGVIRSVYNGTKAISVKITAKLNNDPSGRKVYVSVKTIPVQTEELQYYVSDDVELTDGTVVIPKLKVAESDFSFGIYAQPMNSAGELVNTSLKWTSSNTKIATVAADGMVTVKKNADGIATITATVNDLKKSKISIDIDVRNYAPRLATSTVTLNTNTDAEAQIQMYPVYGTSVNSVRLEGNDSFYATYINEESAHTLCIGANEVVKKGIYKTTLIFDIDGIGEYAQALTIKVANSVPSVTVKQKSVFNLFYLDSEVVVAVTAKNANIANIELSDTDTFKGTFDEDTKELVVSYDDISSKLDKKSTLTIELEGYRNPITKALNINAKETKPTLTMSRKSTNLSALSTEGVPLQITNKVLKRAIDWDNDQCNVSVSDASFAYVETTHEGTNLTIQPILDADYKFANGKTSHSAKLEVQGENWLKPITVTHVVSIITKIPTIKASKSTLTLNSLFGNSMETTIVPNLSNCPVPLEYDITAVKANENTEKLIVEANGWNLKASFADPDDLPAKGSYKYNVVAKIAGYDSEELIKTTVTIKVAPSTPKVTLAKTAVSLNKTISDQIDFAAKITSGYQITGMKIANAIGNTLSEEQLEVTFVPETSMIHLEINDDTISNKTYKYNLTPIVSMDGLDKETETKAIVLSVKVHDNKTSVSAAGKGSIDLLTRENGIVYTITGGKNINYNVNDVVSDNIKLVGTHAEMFDIEVLEPNAKGQPQVKVTAKEEADFSTSVTYKYKLAVKMNHLDQEVESAEFKVKVKQSTMTLKAKGDLTVYQSVNKGHIVIEVVKPVGSQIEELKILETKATTVPKDALSYEITENVDGSYSVIYHVEKPTKLKANASYKLAFAVTPEGKASNKGAQTFTVSLKVKR